MSSFYVALCLVEFTHYVLSNMKNIKHNLKLFELIILGTTIVGLQFKDGIVMAADTRATAGSIIGDKNCFKLHYLAPNIWCAGCGTAADCDHVTEMIKRDLELHRLNTGTETRVATAVTRLSSHLFNYMGHIGAGIIIGGIDVKGAQLWEVDPHGHTI